MCLPLNVHSTDCAQMLILCSRVRPLLCFYPDGTLPLQVAFYIPFPFFIVCFYHFILSYLGQFLVRRIWWWSDGLLFSFFDKKNEQVQEKDTRNEKVSVCICIVYACVRLCPSCLNNPTTSLSLVLLPSHLLLVFLAL